MFVCPILSDLLLVEGVIYSDFNCYSYCVWVFVRVWWWNFVRSTRRVRRLYVYHYVSYDRVILIPEYRIV